MTLGPRHQGLEKAMRETEPNTEIVACPFCTEVFLGEDAYDEWAEHYDDAHPVWQWINKLTGLVNSPE